MSRRIALRLFASLSLLISLTSSPAHAETTAPDAAAFYPVRITVSSIGWWARTFKRLTVDEVRGHALWSTTGRLRGAQELYELVDEHRLQPAGDDPGQVVLVLDFFDEHGTRKTFAASSLALYTEDLKASRPIDCTFRERFYEPFIGSLSHARLKENDCAGTWR
ncbi:MAG: hypothetical protein HY749_13335 [Gammaproteobacteria bacterium]|nr:hypothetical protein [Gammaproteobacteria bacterium]MBI5616066.1 hypothetical protein [Gammaproteobacteria bacterium]